MAGSRPGTVMKVPYVLGRLAALGMGPEARNARDEALSETMMNAWAQFAATGDPNGAVMRDWQRYDAVGDNYLELDDELKVRRGWRSPQNGFS